MSGDVCYNVWDGIVTMPLSKRQQKPRESGLTMVMDKGLGLNETIEMLSVAGRYIDYIKLAFGTSALYDEDLLREKICAVKKEDIQIYPGGTFLEIAIMQNKLKEFLIRAMHLGFTAIEVSDGTIHMNPCTRLRAIETAVKMGFKVITEVGKKDPSDKMEVQNIIDQIKTDLDAGASKVIIEARESGQGIGIFDHAGQIIRDQFSELISKLDDPNMVIWEAPLKNQQRELIITFGQNVNLGNVNPTEILALESLRMGLRSDTLKTALGQYSNRNQDDC